MAPTTTSSNGEAAGAGQTAPACTRCGSSERYPSGDCADCQRQRQREIAPAAKRRYNLKTRYGITEDDYETMYQQQQGRCAICAVPKPLCVDHDHKDGKVRGLLCKSCNRAIGMLGDAPMGLLQAFMYLQRQTEPSVPQ